MTRTLRTLIVAPLVAVLALFASPASATGATSGKSSYVETHQLAGWFRGLATTAAAGGTTTSCVVASSAGFGVGDIVQIASATPANAMVRVTAVPDGTHLTVSPAVTTMATSGAVTRVGFSPAAVYVGLMTVCPTDAAGGGLTEVTTTTSGYARVALTQADASWNAPSGTPSTMTNAAQLNVWGTPSGASLPLTVNCVGIWDAATTGNLLYWGTLTTPKTINSGDAQPYFPAAALSLGED